MMILLSGWLSPIIVIPIVPIVIIGSLYSWLKAMRAGVAPIPPQTAVPKTTPTCPPVATAPSDNINYQLSPTDTGGTIAHSSIVLPAGVTVTLASDLTLVANNSIQIDGVLFLPNPFAGPLLASPNLTLICKDGPIILGPQGVIGRGIAPSGTDDTLTATNARASSGPGQNGSNIYLEANVIVIQGEIQGNHGGSGGGAKATGTALGPIGGYATAIGGQAGAGGDVLLCAMEKMELSGTINGGNAGWAGWADARAANGADAYGEAGPGNTGGDVYLTGLGPKPCSVSVSGEIHGGAGGVSLSASAGGGAGGDPGGAAIAQGGTGGDGGTVLFSNVDVTGGTIFPGDGGNGGDATATGGVGDTSILVSGGSGGNANANGGDGGADAPVPQPPGGAATGAAPHGFLAQGKGGDAYARAGSGGNAGLFGVGGNSGSATAQGGAGTTGPATTVGPTAPVGPLPATPKTGGVGPSITSPGAP
jgi:hypothetical protein